MLRWYAVQTRPQAEKKALWHLTRQGFTTYLPVYRRARRHARRTDIVQAPLFPRYLFVAMDVARARWRAINSTIGVVRLIGSGDSAAPVPDSVVEEIQAREDETGCVRLAAEAPFEKGETVRITQGPLAAATGLFQCATDQERVVLLLELLGRQFEVRVPLTAVAGCD